MVMDDLFMNQFIHPAVLNSRSPELENFRKVMRKPVDGRIVIGQKEPAPDNMTQKFRNNYVIMNAVTTNQTKVARRAKK